jgi:ABC-type multidrug transport system fused ATPase/permease subunit
MLIAYRDPTVYYLQLILHSFYGFLIGATFWKLSPSFSHINDIFSGVTWLVFLQCYIQVFKVHYLAQSNTRFHHEFSNRSYGAFSFWAAEFLSVAICSLVFVPGVTIAYFMMELPGKAFGVVIISAYILAIAAESMIHFITQFSRNSAYAVVAAQTFLILLCVFTTGSLITEDRVPGWWVWVQELSFFAHSSRSMAHAVFKEISYECPASYISIATRSCVIPGQPYSFACDSNFVALTPSCSVPGVNILHDMKGLKDVNEWLSFLYLFLLMMAFRIGLLIMYIFPFHEFWVQRYHMWRISSLRDFVFSDGVLGRRLEREVGMLRLRLNGLDASFKAAVRLQRAWRSYIRRKRFRSAVMEMVKQIRSGTQHTTVDMSSSLVWKNLCLSLANKKLLIDHVDGQAMGGRVLALMGPSGAGKTTLLNALSGRAAYAKVTGSVWLNGRPMRQDDINFVPQFDDLNGSLNTKLFPLPSLLLPCHPLPSCPALISPCNICNFSALIFRTLHCP